jgi:hypothetical protein
VNPAQVELSREMEKVFEGLRGRDRVPQMYLGIYLPHSFIMRYKDYSQVQTWKKELVRKIGLFGLSDLRKLAPIGDLGYANGWYWNPSGEKGFMYGEMEIAILKAFREQGFKFDKGYSSGYRGTDHHSTCTELGLRYSVDSSD